MNINWSTVFISRESKLKAMEFGLILLSIIVTAIFQFSGFSLVLLNSGHRLLSPFLKINVQLVSKMYNIKDVFHQQQQLIRRVQDLEIRLSQSQARLGDLDQLSQENEELRQLLNSSNRSLRKIILTRPILSYAQPTVSISVDEEVAIGSAVLIKDTLVGQIKDVKQGTASVDLLWQNDSSPVLATTEAGVQGVIVGDGKRVIFTEVPITDELEIGQRVTATGQRGIEKGLYVGEIRSLQTGASSAVQTAVIEQHVSFYEAQLVEIRL